MAITTNNCKTFLQLYFQHETSLSKYLEVPLSELANIKNWKRTAKFRTNSDIWPLQSNPNDTLETFPSNCTVNRYGESNTSVLYRDVAWIRTFDFTPDIDNTYTILELNDGQLVIGPIMSDWGP